MPYAMGNDAIRGYECEVMTDERLDYLAERFGALRVRELLGVPFVWYLRSPEEFDGMAVRESARRALLRADGGMACLS